MMQKSEKKCPKSDKAVRHQFVAFRNERDSMGRLMGTKNTQKNSFNILNIFEVLQRSLRISAKAQRSSNSKGVSEKWRRKCSKAKKSTKNMITISTDRFSMTTTNTKTFSPKQKPTTK